MSGRTCAGDDSTVCDAFVYGILAIGVILQKKGRVQETERQREDKKKKDQAIIEVKGISNIITNTANVVSLFSTDRRWSCTMDEACVLVV